MRLVAPLLLALSLLWPLACRPQSAPPQPSADDSPQRVQTHDVPDDEEEDEEGETPWTLYAVLAGFTLFGAVVFLVISRGGRSGKG